MFNKGLGPFIIKGLVYAADRDDVWCFSSSNVEFPGVDPVGISHFVTWEGSQNGALLRRFFRRLPPPDPRPVLALPPGEENANELKQNT